MDHGAFLKMLRNLKEEKWSHFIISLLPENTKNWQNCPFLEYLVTNLIVAYFLKVPCCYDMIDLN